MMQLLKLPDVIKLTGLSKSSIYRGMRAGLFPRRCLIAPRAVAWSENEIQQWIQRCIEQSR
jgi:prophage regulatory protein